MRAAVLIATLCCAAAASAAESRIQNRLLTKANNLYVTAGPLYLERADYYVSPGLGAQATWFWSEDDGLEVRGAWLFSTVSASAEEVIAQTQLALDAPRPRALLLGGWRHAFGYGKVKVSSLIVHFDVTGAVHGGALFTERGAAPALSVSPGLLLRVTPEVFAAVDLSALATVEPRRRRAFNLGLLPSLSVGLEL